jgi:hypothetical protein
LFAQAGGEMLWPAEPLGCALDVARGAPA